MGLLDIASIFLVVVFLASTISFVAYIVRRKNGRRLFAIYAIAVGVFGFCVYLLNVFGVVSTPLPVGIGRFLVVSLAFVFALIAVAIWRW